MSPALVVTGAFAPPGLGEGQVFGVQGLAVGPGPVIFASDYANNRIQRFGPDGAALGAFGSTGSRVGQLLGPRGMAITGDMLVVADEANHRVHVFGLDGSPKGTWGEPGNQPGELLRPADVAVRRDGTTFVLDAGNARVQAVESGIVDAVWGSTPAPHWSPRGLAWSAGLGLVAAGHRSGSEASGPGETLIRVFTSAGQLALETVDPSGTIQEPVAASSWNGGFALADPVAGVVAAFGADGRPVDAPASDVVGPYGLVEALGDGASDPVALWVSESLAARVRGFDADGNPARSLASGEVAWPMGLSLGSPGDGPDDWSVLVADRDANRIMALDPNTGTTREAWGPADPPVAGPVSAVTFAGGLAYADAAGVHWTTDPNDGGAAGAVTSLAPTGGPDGILDPGELAVAESQLFAADPVRGRIHAFGTWPENRWRLRIWANPWRSGLPDVARWADAPAVPDAQGWPATVSPDHASVTLEGQLDVAAGWYSVVVEASGPVRLWVGDRLVMQGAADKATLRLAGRPMPVRLDYEPDRLVALGLRWEPLPTETRLWLPRVLQSEGGTP